MNYPAASSGVSNEDQICLIAASDELLDLALRNKKSVFTGMAIVAVIIYALFSFGVEQDRVFPEATFYVK